MPAVFLVELVEHPSDAALERNAMARAMRE
jgi:hypothetical protein